MTASLTASCRCGNISVTVPRLPSWINHCQCGVCYRYGVGWAYYPLNDAKITVKPGKSTSRYAKEGGSISMHFCSNCGCMMYWWPNQPDPEDPEGMAVNTNCMPVEQLRKVERRFMYDMND